MTRTAGSGCIEVATLKPAANPEKGDIEQHHQNNAHQAVLDHGVTSAAKKALAELHPLVLQAPGQFQQR